jgi:hypothetical protein
MLLSDATLQRYLSTSLCEKRVLDMQRREDVRQSAQPGALIASCPICSYGTDLTILDPPVETTASCSGVRELARHEANDGATYELSDPCSLVESCHCAVLMPIPLI